jgi:hypothetical protein
MTERRTLRQSETERVRKTPSLEPMPPLRIEISEEEILANLLYPASAERGRA